MIDGQNFFDQHKLFTYDSIRKIATCQRDDYTTGCLLDCNYFKNYQKMIAISKQQVLDGVQKQYSKLFCWKST